MLQFFLWTIVSCNIIFILSTETGRMLQCVDEEIPRQRHRVDEILQEFDWKGNDEESWGNSQEGANKQFHHQDKLVCKKDLVCLTNKNTITKFWKWNINKLKKILLTVT